jgi:hypothetical protein
MLSFSLSHTKNTMKDRKEARNSFIVWQSEGNFITSSKKRTFLFVYEMKMSRHYPKYEEKKGRSSLNT